MYTVSAEFLNFIRQSGRRRIVADVYYGSSAAPIASDIPISDGSLTIDRGADIRRSGSMTISQDDINLSIFDPIGTEVAIRAGVVLPNGAEELVPLGQFLIAEVAISEGDSKSARISFFDRAKHAVDHPSLFPQSTTLTGNTAQNCIEFYLNYLYIGSWYTPSITFDSDLVDYKVPGGVLQEGTHWEIMKRYAEGMNAEIFFDVTGNLVVQPIATVSSETTVLDSVWAVDVGENGVLLSADRSKTRDSTYNIVAYYGTTDANGRQARAQVYDTNPLSPTYYWGNFGKRSIRFDNELLSTSAACLGAATSKLAELTGLAKTVSFGALFNPALDAGDIVAITFLDGTTEIHLIESLSFNLLSGEMSGTTRTVQYVI